MQMGRGLCVCGLCSFNGRELARTATTKSRNKKKNPKNMHLMDNRI